MENRESETIQPTEEDEPLSTPVEPEEGESKSNDAPAAMETPASASSDVKPVAETAAVEGPNDNVKNTGDATPADEEQDSSDDDSSYFADPSNLPSPKSAGRRFSWSSNHSLNRMQSSDASLSLSDDSEQERKEKPPPDLQAQHRITRLHSVSSLMSTESHSDDDDDDENDPRQPYVHPRRTGQTGATPQQWVHVATNTHYHREDSSSHRDVLGQSLQSSTGNHSLVYSEDGEAIQQSINAYLDEQPPSVTDKYNSNKTELNQSRSGVDRRKGRGFQVYWQRWIMLFYMSILNLLSDWTCYSVAPIAVLTEGAFGNINPEQLVVVFLGANAIATACEPIILSRLGLRKTVVLGGLLLMIGSIVKSGGMPPIISAGIEKGHGQWRVYLGFFLVGLSQPLYQCTPALLSASWFPDKERTMATGVALNANQLGIGFAFIFGTLLVKTSDDIPNYFGLLSIMSTITFLGTLFQFDDAPPTPPSDTARVMRGDLEIGLPHSVRSFVDSVRNLGASLRNIDSDEIRSASEPRQSGRKFRKKTRRKRKNSKGNEGTIPGNSESHFHGLAPAPSPAMYGRVTAAKREIEDLSVFPAPSPMMPGPVGGDPSSVPQGRSPETGNPEGGANQDGHEPGETGPYYPQIPQVLPYYYQPQQLPSLQGESASVHPPQYGYLYPPYPMYQYSYHDPRMTQHWQMYNNGYPLPQTSPYEYAIPSAPPFPYFYGYQYPSFPAEDLQGPDTVLPTITAIDEGAEPVLTMTDHHLDINIRDDQILLSTRACLSRPGFIHSLVSFTVSGIVINTLSTFMDYLVRLNGAGREYTGIVGGSFQFGIMLSSLIIGKITDRTRAYYSITIGMLVLGAFGLAQCGVSLDADRGEDLRWSLIVVALLVGPLQPVSTELGVDVVYPLSENTVLVIQQLFSNLSSALFIPFFKALKDFGNDDESEIATEKPEFTFSFYLLIVLHAAATVFFATFQGRYLRYEHELAKKEADDADYDTENSGQNQPWEGEHRPLLHPLV